MGQVESSKTWEEEGLREIMADGDRTIRALGGLHIILCGVMAIFLLWCERDICSHIDAAGKQSSAVATRDANKK